MSANIQTFITCDGGRPGCLGTYSDGDVCYEAAHVQRRKFFRNEDAGGRWYFSKGKDYCPVCWKAMRGFDDQVTGDRDAG